MPAASGRLAGGLRRMGRLGALFAPVLLLAVVASPVLGHAELVASDPADGAVVDTPPATVTLTFSDGLNQSRSNFELLDGSGSRVGTGRAAEDGDKVMTLGGLTLGAGAYSIRWVSVAEDGDVLRGELTFTVTATTPTPTATPSGEPSSAPGATASALPTPVAAASAAPPASPSPQPTTTGAVTTAADSGGNVVLPIIVALVIVGGIGVWVVRRSRTAP
jgi:methionine-rich copper-binding protein CopC